MMVHHKQVFLNSSHLRLVWWAQRLVSEGRPSPADWIRLVVGNGGLPSWLVGGGLRTILHCQCFQHYFIMQENLRGTKSLEVYSPMNFSFIRLVVFFFSIVETIAPPPPYECTLPQYMPSSFKISMKNKWAFSSSNITYKGNIISQEGNNWGFIIYTYMIRVHQEKINFFIFFHALSLSCSSLVTLAKN